MSISAYRHIFANRGVTQRIGIAIRYEVLVYNGVAMYCEVFVHFSVTFGVRIAIDGLITVNRLVPMYGEVFVYFGIALDVAVAAYRLTTVYGLVAMNSHILIEGGVGFELGRGVHNELVIGVIANGCIAMKMCLGVDVELIVADYGVAFDFQFTIYGLVAMGGSVAVNRRVTVRSGITVHFRIAFGMAITVNSFVTLAVNVAACFNVSSNGDFAIGIDAFNRGDYALAMKETCDISAMTSILYPDDSQGIGRKLRLRQEYLMVAAGLGNITRAYTDQFGHNAWAQFPDRVSIHINDTHPTLCIPELMRILLDDENLEWVDAWEITRKTISFTNHTVLPEALEKWPIDMFQTLLPRIYMIIEEIDKRFREYLNSIGISNAAVLKKTSVLWDGEIRMANLSIIGSHSTNGVAALHTQILKDDVFKNFYELFPERFNNKTNGVSHRRFLLQSNPGLAQLLGATLGNDWKLDPESLEQLTKYADNAEFLTKLKKIKYENKLRLAAYVKKTQNIDLDPTSVFDVQVKRIHAYKRQLMFALKILDLYNRLIDNPGLDIHPYTFIIAGKAAQGNAFAKDVIYLINIIANMVNNDERVNKKIKVVFIENFCTSNAQLIYPAADISEQISTAGKEASGTGNMKFMMNGAVTLGTLDGANVEIKEHVGDDNIIIFGLTAEEAMNYYTYGGYNPVEQAAIDGRLNRMMTQLIDGTLKDFKGNPIYFWGIYDALMKQGDEYFVLKDLPAYISASEQINNIYSDDMKWGKMSLMNIAKSGYFSSDRTIREYAEDIWHLDYLK